jgi:RNA polymerase sigma factor (TIGR02999 family)
MSATDRENPPVTELLASWRAGDADALDRLMPLVYGELRRLARRQVAREGAEQTLSATDLVHEAFLRLAGAEVAWQDRAHFLALAARLMRRVLVDRARSRSRLKRGGGLERITLDAERVASPEPTYDLVALDTALEDLAAFDPRKAQAIDLVIFGGLTYDQAAAALGTSRATLHRHLTLAKAWLHDQIAEL